MRARGMSLTTASDWLFECLAGLAAPPLLRALRGGYYLLLAGACGLSGLAVLLVYVETGGTPLEAIGGVFGDAQPPPRKIEQEDKVLRVRRRRVRGRSAVSMTSQLSVGLSASAGGTSQVTLHDPAGDGEVGMTEQLAAVGRVAGASQVTLHPSLAEKTGSDKGKDKGA